jgi:hypothetical protein
MPASLEACVQRHRKYQEMPKTIQNNVWHEVLEVSRRGFCLLLDEERSCIVAVKSPREMQR